MSNEKIAAHEFKEHTQHVEHAHDGTGLGGLQRPAVMLTPEEEAKLYRKLDWHLLPMLGLLYLLSFMDRGNIGNARLSGLEEDLNMTGDDYAIALSAFFLTYCLAEVPANAIMKQMKPSIWLGSITVTWGIIMTLMGVVHNFAGLVSCRLALGIAAATLAGAFSGLLAYGIGFMAGVGGYNGWQEGLMTVVAGVGAFWGVLNTPETCKFLTPDEAAWIVWRKKSDGSAHGESEHLNWVEVKGALTSWQCWLALGFYMGIVVPLYSVGLFAPTLIQAFGTYSRPQVQLLTIPVYAFACIYVVTTAIWSDRIRKRFPFVMAALTLCLLGLIINLTPAPSGVKYFGLFLLAAGAYGGLPSVVTWLSNNLAGQTKRAIGSAFQIGIGNLGGLASSNIYRTVDRPRYFLGHGTAMGFVVLGLITAPLYAFLLSRANAAKELELEVQNSLPDAERRVYTLDELHRLGDKHIEFKYTL